MRAGQYNPAIQGEEHREHTRATTANERKGNRLSKIVTRTGDAGTTGLGDGSRTTKDSLRIDAIGEIDELNSSLGLLLCEEMPDAVRAALLDIQNDLFDLGGELCLPGMEVIKDAQVARLEELAEAFNADLPMLKEFILPGGTRAAASPTSPHRLPPRRARHGQAARRRTACPTPPAATSTASPTCSSSSAASSTAPAAVATCSGKKGKNAA
jgi:ATP:cob(I)alamin adenosyltransferase